MASQIASTVAPRQIWLLRPFPLQRRASASSSLIQQHRLVLAALVLVLVLAALVVLLLLAALVQAVRVLLRARSVLALLARSPWPRLGLPLWQASAVRRTPRPTDYRVCPKRVYQQACFCAPVVVYRLLT